MRPTIEDIMYPSLESVLHLEKRADIPWKTDPAEPAITVQFAGRFINTGDEYLLSVNGMAYSVTFGRDLDEGLPESILNRDIQVVAELEPGEEIFVDEFQPIHVIEIIS